MEILNKIRGSIASDLEKTKGKERIIIVAIILFAFIIGITSTTIFFPATIPQNPRFQPTITPIPVNLTLSSDKKEVLTGATFAASLNLNSYNQGIEAAGFTIKFDPDTLRVATVSAGNFFSEPQNQAIGKDTIQLTGIAVITDKKIIVPKGEGVIADIIFEALTATPSTSIKIDKSGTIVTSGGNDILGKTKDLEISIK